MVSIISGQLEYRLLQDFELGWFDSEAQATAAAEASDLRQQVVAILYLLTFIIAGATILRWIYRANQNARLLGAEGMTFTPGWSVGWYFVPIACLWKPYQAMKEIWRASHRPGDWQTVPAGALVSWWWLLWIVSNILGQAIFRMSLRAEDLDELMFVNRLQLTSDVLDIGLNVVTLMLVNRIYGAQVAYFQAGQVVHPPVLNPMEISAPAEGARRSSDRLLEKKWYADRKFKRPARQHHRLWYWAFGAREAIPLPDREGCEPGEQIEISLVGRQHTVGIRLQQALTDGVVAGGGHR